MTKQEYRTSFFLQHADRICKEIAEETMIKVNGVEVNEKHGCKTGYVLVSGGVDSWNQ